MFVSTKNPFPIRSRSQKSFVFLFHMYEGLTMMPHVHGSCWKLLDCDQS
jgi:hypothetical protein